MPTATLSPENKTTIRSAIGHECHIFSATVCKLYFAYPDANRWTFAATGAIAFMKDIRKNNCFFFRFVHLKSGTILWEQELYKDFVYIQEKPFFHTFASDLCMVGLSFANDHEALVFFSKVMSRDSLVVQKKSRPTSVVPSIVNGPSSNSSTAGNTSTVNRSNSKGKKGKVKLDKSAIGAPTNFKHLTHVGYDPAKGGFNTMNIPPEWKSVFEKAGVTEKELQDENTAKFIVDFMSQYKEPSKAPVAPFSGPTRAAPQVPGSSDSLKRAPPPPTPTPSKSSAPVGAPKGPPPPPPSRPKGTSSNESAPPPPSRPDPGRGSLGRPPANAPYGSAPPPPPPPPPPSVSSSEPAEPILKKSAPRVIPPPVDPRNDLLASIRKAGISSLKPAAEREVPPSEKTESAPAGGGDVASALRAALMSRQAAVGHDDETEDEEDDEW